MGDRWLHLPICHSPPPLCLVDEVQLLLVRGIRFERRDRSGAHLLLPAVPPERDYRTGHHPKLVGEYRVPEHSGLPIAAAENCGGGVVFRVRLLHSMSQIP